MQVRCATFVSLLLFVTFAASAESHEVGEIQLRQAIADNATTAFNNSDFAALEEQSREFRAHKSRTPSGVWKLTFFYAGITVAVNKLLDTQGKLSGPISQWEEQYPQSPSAHITRSIVLIARAWRIRGNKAASHVGQSDWKPFLQGIADARRNLENYKDVSSSDPEWYEQMLVIARAEDWERVKFDATLDEGLSKEPFFYGTYFSALAYLLPKWHGDIDEIDRFISDAVERTSKQEGRGMYTRIYWDASQTEFNDDLFENSKASWPLMKAGFNDIVATYPSYWNLNSFAKFACLAGDKPKTKELTTRLAGHIEHEAWSTDVNAAECASWANSRSNGPKGQQRHRASKSRGIIARIESNHRVSTN